jgi:hypothetical protein
MGIYKHFSHVPWDKKRWPNFSPGEPNLACPCCGEFCLDPASFDGLQALRDRLGRPVRVNSGHRCFRHNARVGGAPLSMHRWLVAFDVSLQGHRPSELLEAARKAGFSGFGYYATFLHLDRGRPRWWITKGGARIWTSHL